MYYGIIDDYYPSSSKEEVRKMKNAIETVTKMCYERVSGANSKSNGELRKTPRARGQVIGTAEKIPDVVEGRISRMLILNVKMGEIKEDELEYEQERQEELQYSMKKFIEDVIENYEEIKIEIPIIFKEKFKEARKYMDSRTAEPIVGLYIGYKYLIDFSYKNEVITLKQKENMIKEGWEILINVGKEQGEIVETTSPINMLLTAVESLTSTGKLTTVDYKDANSMTKQELMQDGFVGYYKVEKNKTGINLIYPDLLYKSVKNFYSQQGLLFPWNQSEMCKELFTQGFLYKTGKQGRPQIRRPNPRTNREETFIGVLQDKIDIACRYRHQGIILTR